VADVRTVKTAGGATAAGPGETGVAARPPTNGTGSCDSGYTALESGDPTGWELGQATSSTVDMDDSGDVSGGDITSRTRYDVKGRVIENRQPDSDGTDAGTRETVHYTGDGSAPTSACRNKPDYAGMVCRGRAKGPAGREDDAGHHHHRLHPDLCQFCRIWW
jgi:hypothetical protein